VYNEAAVALTAFQESTEPDDLARFEAIFYNKLSQFERTQFAQEFDMPTQADQAVSMMTLESQLDEDQKRWIIWAWKVQQELEDLD